MLPGLTAAADKVASEILLVDNRSTDGSLQFVQKNYPQINVLSIDKKAGYGENHNANLQRATGRYFVIMNSDMTVEPDIFRALGNYLDQHSDVGIVTPKILNEDGSIQGLNKRHPTILDLALRRFLPNRLRPLFQARLDYYEMRDVGYDHFYDVPFISGAFMFCRTDLLKTIKGFDPRYFLYFEDVDLCRRVQLTHRTVYYPDVSVVHFWQRAAHKNWRHSYYFFSSAFRYFNQWGYKLA